MTKYEYFKASAYDDDFFFQFFISSYVNLRFEKKNAHRKFGPFRFYKLFYKKN